MKKLFFITAVAAIALTSCQREKNFNGRTADANEIAFAIQGNGTRSAETVAAVQEGASIPIGKVDNFNLYLEETIVDLNALGAETRGTPVYSENVGYLYKNQLGVYAINSQGGVDASYARLEDGPRVDDQGKTQWAYQHRYNVNIWENETTKVQFHLRMPADMNEHGVNSIAYDNSVVTVSYTSPTTAAAQEDIIFGGIKMDHKEYMGHYSSTGGAPVTLYHALTGVKFAIKNTTAELAKIQINKISFIGLKNKGTLTFTSPSTVAWSDLEVTTVPTNVGEGDEATTVDLPNTIYQTYEAGDLVTYDATTHASNNFASSFFSAGTSQNLNKADASYTFWLIPQQIDNTSTAVLKIEYTISGKNEYMEIPFDLLKASNWQAGQLRTYTFKLDEVNVKISDTVEIPQTANASNGFKGAKKSGVTITNTGNTKAFIRAAIVGQWLDTNNNPVFGFTDEINQLYVVESWYEDQFVNKDRKHGKFVGLPGYSKTGGDNPLNDWQLCEDGYYYYTKVVAPGAATGSALFTSYETLIVPAAAIAGDEMDASEMHFELEIATQAISAVKLDGTEYTWTEAWYRALGEMPVIKSAN
jgi:hypothetical protein